MLWAIIRNSCQCEWDRERRPTSGCRRTDCAHSVSLMYLNIGKGERTLIGTKQEDRGPFKEPDLHYARRITKVQSLIWTLLELARLSFWYKLQVDEDKCGALLTGENGSVGRQPRYSVTVSALKRTGTAWERTRVLPVICRRLNA
jgi:hypothetical protein